jgi:hypothetical protein
LTGASAGLYLLSRLGAHTSQRAGRVASITPKDLTHFPPAIRQALESAFAQALPPIYAYLVPLAGAAFLLALILPEIQLRTRAHSDRQAPGRAQGAAKDHEPLPGQPAATPPG